MTSQQTTDIMSKLRKIAAGVDVGDTNPRVAARQIDAVLRTEGVAPPDVILWMSRRWMREAKSPK